MLALIGFDATSPKLLDELCDAGEMPRLAALRRDGVELRLATPASHFHAGAFATLWTGLPVGEHGLHYPFMWDAGEQRVRYCDHFPTPPALWERVSAHGGRVLVVDPYEASRPGPVAGLCLSGWQFRNRVVLRGWSEPAAALRSWSGRLGRAPRAEEVFGEPTERHLRSLARTLIAGPRRVADVVAAAIGDVRPDVLVAGFPSLHLAGHQLWDPAAVLPDVGRDARRELGGALRRIYVEADAALGRVVDALPEGSDVIVFSIIGMDADASRTDVLEPMLRAVLDGPRPGGDRSHGAWRFRSAVPTSFRSLVADALPDRAAVALAARMELRGVDWSQTRAFVVPSDVSGYIRFNIRGRERDGILEPADAPALIEELRAGLGTYVLPTGEPAVRAVEETIELVGRAPAATLLPDLIVHWSPTPARRDETLSSERFGTVRRQGVGSGRSGNHTDEAWAVVVSASGSADGRTTADVRDIAATALAQVGVETGGTTLVAS